MNHRSSTWSGLLVWIATTGACTLAFDFDDLEGLPCPCDVDHVCDPSSETCIRRGSVDPGKSCGLDVANPDDLCPEGTACLDIPGRGPRCLRPCTTTVPLGDTLDLDLRTACGPGQYCWPVAGSVGACDEGECEELGNSGCEPGFRCIELNSAGVCFAECNPFAGESQCLSSVCQPLDRGSVNACVLPGTATVGEACDSDSPCALQPGEELICARPASSTDVPRCAWVCRPDLGVGCPAGSACVEIEGSPVAGLAVGVCSQ